MQDSNWELAKTQLDYTEFPDFTPTRETEKYKGSYHIAGKERHEVEDHEMAMPDIKGFKCTACYNWCRECAEIRNKYIVLLHPMYGVYIKEFTKSGKMVK